MLNKKGFTLVEILIIIAIIGILMSAITISLMSARNRAKDSSFKNVAKSIQTALVSCCIKSGTALGNISGGPVCLGGSNYPDASSIETISSGDCNGNSFSKTITPGKKNNGNCTGAIITTEEIVYSGC